MSYVHWNTPPEVLYLVRDMCGQIGLDPCSNPRSMVLAKREYLFPEQDGLLLNWFVDRGEAVFVNPPYSLADNWPWAVKWAEESRLLTQHLFGLVQAAPGTAWFHIYMRACDAVCFPAKRLAFWKDGFPVSGANFGNALFYAGPDKEVFQHHFTPLGTVLYR